MSLNAGAWIDGSPVDAQAAPVVNALFSFLDRCTEPVIRLPVFQDEAGVSVMMPTSRCIPLYFPV